MGRVLSVARVTVPPEHQAEYVSIIHALAEFGETRGQHLWLFRSDEVPGLFLECSESRTEMSHRNRASRTDREMKLEKRLQFIAHYEDGGGQLWDEVGPPEERASSGWSPDSESDDQ